MHLVDLADEFHLTTTDAVDLCLAAGIPAETSDAELNANEVVRFRDIAQQQKEWRDRAEAERLARAERVRPSADPAAASAFGPIPPAPWEAGAGPGSAQGPARAPDSITAGAPPALAAGWGVDAGRGEGTPQVSIYAAAALGIGVVSLIFPFLPSVIAIVMALYAKGRIRQSRGALSGERLASAAIGVSALGIALWLGIFGAALWTQHQDQEAKARLVDIQVDRGTVAWNEIAPGMCVRVPRADVPVESWRGLDCTAPHEAEVFYRASVDTAKIMGYPGRDSFIPLAKQQCINAFSTYVGEPYTKSDLHIGVYFPSAYNWNTENDHSFGCIVFQDKYALINGSLKNSAS